MSIVNREECDAMSQSLKEIKEILAELTRKQVEADARWEQSNKEFKERWEKMEGVGLSNGMVAENYFYRSLRDGMTFGGVHYDDVDLNWRKKDKKKGVQGQYDIVMLNDTSVCLIEVKYRARKEDVVKLWQKKVDSFKILFPEYAGHTFYLGIGGMCFEDEESILEEAKEHGIGVLTIKGDIVEIQDDGLKAY